LSCVSSSIYAAWTSIGTACTAGTRATFTTSGTTTGPAASAAARASATTTLGYSTGDTQRHGEYDYRHVFHCITPV
jgi:hypothetical protein